MRQSRTAKTVSLQTEDVNEPGREPLPSPRRGLRTRATEPGNRWVRQPRTAVWAVLAIAVLLGGGRKLLLAWRARKAVNRLAEADVTPPEIEAAAEHGRAGVYELLRIFSSPAREPARHAAGRALARLWRLDHLVAEEEQAVVRRGYTVTWSARRRYPRALSTAIPINVTCEIPFLEDGGRLIGPANLEWSHRVLGARRAALETFSPWTAGRGQAVFTIVPGDFATNGPHRLVLETRVRTATGLTDSWEIELPHIPFHFEFDPILQLDAILTLADSVRDDQIAQSIHLEPGDVAPGEPAIFLAVGDDWTLRNPPSLAITTPLPCDLAHAISVEFEGMPVNLPAGRLILTGQGTAPAMPRAIRRSSEGSS